MLSFLTVPLGTSWAVGVYDDPAELAAFLFAPQDGSVVGRMAFVDGVQQDASIYTVGATFDVKPWFLLVIEQPFIVYFPSDEILSEFGDLHVRGRIELMTRPRSAVHSYLGLRTGLGTELVYPYATGSVDFEFGIGAVDTLDVLRLWAVLSATFVVRQPEELKQSDLYDNFATIGLGAVIPLGQTTGLNVGVIGYIYRQLGVRQLFTAGLNYDYSEVVKLFANVNAEAGRREDNIFDLSLTLGIRVFH